MAAKVFDKSKLPSRHTTVGRNGTASTRSICLEDPRAVPCQLLQVMVHDNLHVFREVLPFVRAERMERFIKGLHKVGLPEN